MGLKVRLRENRIQLGNTLTVQSKLTREGQPVDTCVQKRREGNRPNDRDSVFEVRNRRGITSRKDQLINRDCLTYGSHCRYPIRVDILLDPSGAVVIQYIDGGGRRNIGDWADGQNVESS